MSKVGKLFRRLKKPKKSGQELTPSSSEPSSAPSLSTSTLVTTQTPPDHRQPTLTQSTEANSTNLNTEGILAEKEHATKASSTPLENKTKAHDLTLKIMGPLIDGLSIAKNAAEAAGDVSGPLKAAFGIGEKVLTMARAVVENDKAWEELATELEDHQAVLNQHIIIIEKHKQVSYFTPPDDTLMEAIDDYAKVLERIRGQVIEGEDRFNKKKAKSYLMQVPTTRIQAETIVRLRRDLGRGWSFLQGRINLLVMHTTRRIEEHVASIRISQTLQVAAARGESVGKLLSGTREDILEKISTWADDKSSLKQIFWLCDGPGTGKSTIAAHMANIWKEQGRLVGTFFFSKEDKHTRDIERFCATIAYQAKDIHPISLRYIVNLRKDPSFLPFFEKFDLLVKGLLDYLIENQKPPEPEPEPSDDPTPSQSHEPVPFIIVIDSLDQCDPYDQSRLLEALLHRLPATTSARIFITSTILPDTRHPFHTSDLVLRSAVYDHLSTSSRKDIELYVRGQLATTLSEYQQDQVIDAANGVFQVAFVACAALKDAVYPTGLLKQLKDRKPDANFTSLYATILDGIKAGTWGEDDDEINAFRTVLQAVVLAYRPVTVATHHAFLPQMDLVPDYVQKIVRRFAGIIQIGGEHEDGPVYILHPTFRTYLLGLQIGETFNIAASAGHAHVANGCLKLLEGIHRDLCGVVQDRDTFLPVSNPMELPQKVIAQFGTDNSMPLRYAVVFWVRHAAEGLEHEDIREKVLPFFERKLLIWIEWAAAIRELPECIVGLEELVRRLDIRVNLHSQKADITALRLSQDALRFLKSHKPIIDQSAMQVYYSALAFDSRRSLVSVQYQPTLSHPLPVIIGHSAPLLSSAAIAVVISTDGNLLATTDGDQSIHLWDANTLEIRESCQGGHGAVTTYLAFSPSGRLLVSGLKDGSIQVLKIAEVGNSGSSRIEIGGTGDLVDCLSISVDDTTIICKTQDGSISIWNIQEKSRLSSYTLPELAPVDGSELLVSLNNNDGAEPRSFIALSSDQKSIALCSGNSLRVFAINDESLFEFVTIRYGRPAQPVFSQTLTKAKSPAAGHEYLYWGDWVLDLRDYQRDSLRFLSKGSAEEELSTRLDSAGPATRPAPLLYATKSPGRINSYRMADDAGLLLLPLDIDISCWAAARTKVVVGSTDGRVVVVDFAGCGVLGKDEDDVVEEAESDEGFETASDRCEDMNGGEEADLDDADDDFFSAIEGPMSRRGSAT